MNRADLFKGMMNSLYWAPSGPPPIFHLDLEVVWQDQWMAIVVKPPGIPVSGNCYRSVEKALPINISPSNVLDVLIAPRPVHRLDVPTGGLLLVAKSSQALINLSRQLQERAVRKRYRAIVTGRLEGENIITDLVDGRKAETVYRPIAYSRSLRTDWITTVDLIPKSGRTHQLRKHLSGIGHPIVGDGL